MLKNKKNKKQQKTTFYLSKIKLDSPPEKTQQQQLKYL